MQRTSKYYDLEWIVECQEPGQAFYESIAAFNVEETAKDYARDCYASKKRFGGMALDYKYRVTERSGSNHVVIAIYPRV